MISLTLSGEINCHSGAELPASTSDVFTHSSHVGYHYQFSYLLLLFSVVFITCVCGKNNQFVQCCSVELSWEQLGAMNFSVVMINFFKQNSYPANFGGM